MGFIIDMIPHLVLAALLAILIRTVSRQRPVITRNGRPLRKPPGTLLLIGNGFKFLQPRWQLFSWFNKCQQQFGYETVALTVPTLPPGVLVHDPKVLNFIFKNEGLFAKGAFVKKRTWDLFGDGIINADGDLWKLQRKAGAAFLTPANLRVLTDVALPQYLGEAVSELTAKADGKTIVDLQHIFHEITSKIMGKMAYNMEMHADEDFTKSFDFASGGIAERFQNPFWQLTERFTGSKLRKSIATVKDYGQHIVSRAVTDRSFSNPDLKSSKLDQISGSLIQSLLNSIPDHATVANAALTYLSAGRDTTAQALTWAFYLLLRHPTYLTKIREELTHFLAQDLPSDLENPLPINPTLLTPSSAPYTLAVFYETIRLYPPIPFEIRQCKAPPGTTTTLPDGTVLPHGAVLVWCLFALQRSKLTWGEDADRFRPERFLVEVDGPGDGRKRISFQLGKTTGEFPVFYGGSRTCLGRRMAEAVAVQVIAVLAWLFEFEEVDKSRERISGSSLTLPMEGGLPVRVKRCGKS